MALEQKPFLRIFLKPDGRRWYDFPFPADNTVPLQQIVNTIHMEGYIVGPFTFVRWDEIQSGTIITLAVEPNKPNLIPFPGGAA